MMTVDDGWIAAKSTSGYGKLYYQQGKTVKAHRLAYVAATGDEIPAHLVVDHLCRNRACVNPAHLRLVTPRDNVLASNSDAPTASKIRQTHCHRGHPLVDGNLTGSHATRGRRECKTCERWAYQIRAAAFRSLGMTQMEYVGIYGWSRDAALRVLYRHQHPCPECQVDT